MGMEPNEGQSTTVAGTVAVSSVGGSVTVGTVTNPVAVSAITDPVETEPARSGWTEDTVTLTGGSSELFLAADAARKELIILNHGSVTGYFNIAGGTASADASLCIPLRPNGEIYDPLHFKDGSCPVGAIYAFFASGVTIKYLKR